MIGCTIGLWLEIQPVQGEAYIGHETRPFASTPRIANESWPCFKLKSNGSSTIRHDRVQAHIRANVEFFRVCPSYLERKDINKWILEFQPWAIPPLLPRSIYPVLYNISLPLCLPSLQTSTLPASPSSSSTSVPTKVGIPHMRAGCGVVDE